MSEGQSEINRLLPDDHLSPSKRSTFPKLKIWRSALMGYGLAVALFGVVLGVSLLLTRFEVRLNLTILVVGALVVAAWYGGRGPGILLAVGLQVATIILTPIPPDVSMSRIVFSHFSLILLLIFIVLLISGRKNAEMRLREQGEQLQQLNETLEQRVNDRTAELKAANKELEAFSYSVSHDLRAPLRHIDGFVQLLAKREATRLDSTSERYLKVIADAVGKMGLLIDELLAFSRTNRQEIRTASVELNALVTETQHLMAPSIGDRSIKWNIGTLPVVEGDTTLLGLVMSNLISNAIKFTRDRVEALIEVGVLDESNGRATIFVRDNGAGFDMQYADKLFGVFQRLHRDEEFEGIGIGLATVQRIVHRHGGQVWAESETDKGTTIYLTLKKAGEEAGGH